MIGGRRRGAIPLGVVVIKFIPQFVLIRFIGTHKEYDKIENEMQYQVTLKRVEELMLTLPEDTPADDPRMVELTLLGNLVADYDEEHYPIGKPSLIDVIKLRMYEMGLTQAALAGKGNQPASEYRPGHSSWRLAFRPALRLCGSWREINQSDSRGLHGWPRQDLAQRRKGAKI